MGMMLGCSSLAAVRASRWKRSTNSLSKAREKGSTLIATSRSSCFSRARKTMAMPPRPSSWRISYSSLSWSRTMSISVSSCWAAWTCPIGVVAVKSIPQDRQNLKCSSFWVPQLGQYIPAPEGRAVTYGPPRRGVNLRARDHLESPCPDDDAAGGGIGQPQREDVFPAPDAAQIDAAMHARRRSIRDGVEGEQHRGAPPAEQPADRPEQRRPAELLHPHLRVVRRPALQSVHLVVELGHGTFGKAAQRVQQHGVVRERPEEPRARPAHDDVAHRDEQAKVQRVEDVFAPQPRGKLLRRNREDHVQLLPGPLACLPAAHDEIVHDEIERHGEALAVTVGRGAEPDGAMPALAFLGRAAHPPARVHGVQVRPRLPEGRAVRSPRRRAAARALKPRRPAHGVEHALDELVVLYVFPRHEV